MSLDDSTPSDYQRALRLLVQASDVTDATALTSELRTAIQSDSASQLTSAITRAEAWLALKGFHVDQARDPHGRWAKIGDHGHAPAPARHGAAPSRSATRSSPGRRHRMVRLTPVDVQTPAGYDRYITGLRGNPRAPFITAPTRAEMADKHAYLSADGNVGVTVSQNGEIGNLFRNPDAPPGAGRDALDHALAHGGTWLNCFDGALPKIYAQHGLTATARLKWDPGQQPAGWNEPKYDHPDVVFMTKGAPANSPARYYPTWEQAEAAVTPPAHARLNPSGRGR